MTFVDRLREQRHELGLPERVPVFYDDNREPVFADGVFTVEAFDGDEYDEPPP